MGAAWEVFVKQMITLEGYKKVLEGLGNNIESRSDLANGTVSS
jgi:hypothetical protein